MTSDTNETLLQEIFKDEEDYNIVLSIREEIMDRVMDECYKSYLKKQTVKFIVQCAYDALVKYLSFEFYYHPEVPDLTQSIWIADQPLEPSPKDTWSSDAVPVRTIYYKHEQSKDILYEFDSSSFRRASNKEIPVDDVKCCLCLEHVCTCLVHPEYLTKKFDNMYDKTSSGKVKFSPKSSKHSVSKKAGAPDSVTSSLSEIESNQGIAGALSPEISKPVLKVDSEKIKRKQKPQSEIRVMKVDVVEKIPSEPQIDAMGLPPLPPIRVCSTFRSKRIEKPKKR